jgi:hypothetical protein
VLHFIVDHPRTDGAAARLPRRQGITDQLGTGPSDRSSAFHDDAHGRSYLLRVRPAMYALVNAPLYGSTGSGGQTSVLAGDCGLMM